MDDEREEQQQSGFKVTDRRQFTSEGETREEDPQQPAPQEQEPAPQEQEPAPQEQEPAPQEQEPAPQEQEPAPQEQEPAPQEQEPAPQEQQPAAEASQAEEASQASPQDSSRSVDFASFLLSLATTGMVHLGEIPEPSTGQKSEDLEGARQMIEILDIMKVKTEGNLSGEESKLLENLLYELRMKFLSKSKAVEL